MLANEVREEWVEVVRAGGEVEPSWGQSGGDVRVESWHGGDRGGVGDEGRVEDADRRGGHGFFNGVVDVCDGASVFGRQI